MSKIRIVNWLLTRKCNLNCSYCGIVRDPSPYSGYPPLSQYINNEMTTEDVTKVLKNLKLHNPNVFNILYGGEPTLRKDLPDIVNFCNENDINYTIISNNTPGIQPLIKSLFKKTNFVQGFTSSVDPVINDLTKKEDDRIKKSIEGLKRLKEIQAKGLAKDVVAEITVLNENKHILYDLVKDLSRNGIYSDITFVDHKKSHYYDFSNVVDKGQLVYPTFDLAEELLKIKNDDSLLVHMKDLLIPKMFNTLPSEFDCELEKSLHNITIDADGSMRLCLRIRGNRVPIFHMRDIFDKNKNVLNEFHELIKLDKQRLCNMCNHSCLMMSKYIDDEEEGESDLLHKSI